MQTPTPVLKRPFWLEQRLWRQATKDSDTLLTVFAIDPIVRLVLPLFLKSRISPNVVTLIGLGISLVDAWMFYSGDLHVGGILFACWYLIDCVDGKIARLTGNSTKFGFWLDAITDWVGTGIVLFGLGAFFIGEGETTTGLLVLALLLVWFVGIANVMALTQISPSFRTRGLLAHAVDVPTPDESPRKTWELRFVSVGNWLKRELRLSPILFGDPEWLMCALVLGPLTGWVRECLIVSCVALVLQKVTMSTVFWWRRRSEIAIVK